MLVRINMTLNSTVIAITKCIRPMKKGGPIAVKFSLWLITYFIIASPYLTSFSTLICISIEATNLPHIKSKLVAAFI